MELEIIDRVAFQIGSFPVYWYGIIIGAGALIAVLLAFYETKRIGFDFDTFLNTILLAIPTALLGGRLYYVAFHWDYYSQYPSKILAFRDGGIAIHGVILGSLLAGFIYAKIKGFSFVQVAEIAFPSVLLGQAIGRWGNFTNQEAFGGPVSLEFLENLHLPQFIINQMWIDGSFHHPTFLYESIWSIIGVIIILLIRYRNPIRGVVLSFYFIWYSIGRFFIEGLRTDSLAFDGPEWLSKLLEALWAPLGAFWEAGALTGGNIRSAQLFSLLAIILFVGYLIYISRGERSKLRYADHPYLGKSNSGKPDSGANLTNRVDKSDSTEEGDVEFEKED
jgi:phosphatidylglycerol:prolipoprotein diacylglycerol transferase